MKTVDGVVEKKVGQCRCGNIRFKIKSEPLLRVICHCEICQEFNGAPFADILIFDKKNVELIHEEGLEFKSYTNPPLVQRGKCKECGAPAIENFTFPLMPSLVIVPSSNVMNESFLQAPAFHSFYHRRQSEAHDDIPKYSGFVRSQLMFMVKLLVAKLKA